MDVPDNKLYAELHDGSGGQEHNISIPLELCPRYMVGDDISISASSCFDIAQIVEMLEKKNNGLADVDSTVYELGRHYGFVVNYADVGKRQKGGSIAVDLDSTFYSLYTSPFFSPHCGKQRLKLHQDYILSCIVIVTDNDIVESLMDKNNTVSDILTILESAGGDSVVLGNTPEIISQELTLSQVETYLNNMRTETIIPSFLTKPVSFQAKKPNYTKASA